MDGIKIDVTGNIARVIERPAKITSGTVGMPVEFSFDSQWNLLKKVVVFRAGNVIKSVDNPNTVPWEVLEKPGVMLSVGVYGTNADGSVVIPTIWANVSPIYIGVDPDGDPTTEPTPNMWAKMMEYISELTTKPASKVAELTLLASAWVGSDHRYSQVVDLEGITEYSQVDLKPSEEQLAVFHEEDIAFATENDNGVLTVYVVGDRPANDYTMQVSITEVVT